ncbi:hypothetical protein [Nonlabens ponticola]|uniref:hypothetical protein n=1 Tax=Nonlabens ponticola TaxID=2496866 RepID=UPI0013DEBD60|nr:hypothetical protein [Nonlabens ponticola]
MKNQIKSVFNLIDIFRNMGRRKFKKMLVVHEHCASKSLHDYYCDQDRINA